MFIRLVREVMVHGPAPIASLELKINKIPQIPSVKSHESYSTCYLRCMENYKITFCVAKYQLQTRKNRQNQDQGFQNHSYTAPGSRRRNPKMPYDEQKSCDVVLISGNDAAKVPAHKSVLSASSDYFAAMFTGNMIEATATEITIEQIDGATLKALVDFMYSNSIEIRDDNIEILFRTADLFQMKTVVTTCCEYMLKQLNLSNCLGIAFLAEQHNCTKLYEKSFELACKSFERLLTEEEFFELDEEQLVKLLSSDNLCVSSEEQVVHSLVTWTEYKSDRWKSMLNLLSHIRFEWLKPSFVMENKNVLCKSLECEHLLGEWLEWHRKPSKKRTKPRQPIGTPALVSHCALLRPSLKLQTYDPVADEWSTADLPYPLKPREGAFNFVHVNNKLILAGGLFNNEYTNSLECLDLRTMAWTDLPPMRTKRTCFDMAELNEQLYVVGSDRTRKRWLWLPILTKCKTSLERYDFCRREWQTLTPLHKDLDCGVKVAVLDGLLYAIGPKSCALECYDPLLNKWTQKSYKSEKSEMFGFVAAKGSLYALGGWYNHELSHTVERYDPQTDSWTTINPLCIPRLNLTGIAFGILLLIFGGNDVDRCANITEEYDPDTNEWKYLAPIPFFWRCVFTPFILHPSVQVPSQLFKD